jgi:hypothetical protein
VVVARREPPASIHGKTLARPAAKMVFPVTVRLVVVASVVELFTMRRFVMVLVPEFTRIPPSKAMRVVVAFAGNGHGKPPQVTEATSPVVILRQPSAKVSMRRTEVEATPETVIAVVEAYGKTDFVVEVAMRYATVGEVEAEMVVPSELSQPWEKTVCPVPPLLTARVPLMLESVVVATHDDCPSMKVRTYPGVPTPKSVEVATDLASPVEPVGLPRSEAAATCARLENGRSPVTSAVRSTEAQVAAPAPFKLLTN